MIKRKLLFIDILCVVAAILNIVCDFFIKSINNLNVTHVLMCDIWLIVLSLALFVRSPIFWKECRHEKD